jgi:hypothetical protein
MKILIDNEEVRFGLERTSYMEVRRKQPWLSDVQPTIYNFYILCMELAKIHIY